MIKLNNTVLLLLLYTLTTSLSAAGIGVDKLSKINDIVQHQNNGWKYFSATNEGLFVSNDQGHTWQRSLESKLPATMLSETSNGLYAFVLGQGLLKFDDAKQSWQGINNQFDSQILLSLSSEANSPDRLVALNQFRKMIVSDNAGLTWYDIKGKYQPSSDAEKLGLVLFEKNCVSCHGLNDVGETNNLQSLSDQKYLKASALDDSEHAWHHTDEALIKTILNGSNRPSRMPAWKNAGIDQQMASELVAYIKSLWTQRELDCQGPKHMQCM